MVTNQYSNTEEYNTYEESIQQPIDKIKTDYDSHVDTLSELSKKGYNNNLNHFVESFIPNTKHHAKICRESK